MPDHRKPPVHKGGRADNAPPPSDSLDFSIESTTMRLKSMKLRRAEMELDEAQKPTPDNKAADAPRAGEGPSGRVRHDERGMAVWDWAVATGELQTLSATRALKKLEVVDLKVEEAAPKSALSLEKSGRDQGGGFDPYNQRGSGRRQGEASHRQGVTGAADRENQHVLDQLLGSKKK